MRTIAIDPIGYGDSSKNNPVDLDGIDGQVGYSYSQSAYFIHLFLQQLNIQSPITFLGVDSQGNIAVKYAARYVNDPYALAKIVLVNPVMQSLVTDDPCKLGIITTAQAAGLSAFFADDPCAALCAIVGQSFADPACPAVGKILLNEFVNFLSPQPASIFTRIFTQTATEDISNLMEQITIPVLYIFSVVEIENLLYRRAEGIVFTGYCPGCSGPECNTTYVKPFPNCQFVTFNQKGTTTWRTDAKQFNRVVGRFVSGCDLECCFCPLITNIPVVCPPCA